MKPQRILEQILQLFTADLIAKISDGKKLKFSRVIFRAVKWLMKQDLAVSYNIYPSIYLYMKLV